MKKNNKIILILFMIIIIVLIIIIGILISKNTMIIKSVENKEQLTTEDGFITTLEHLNAIKETKNSVKYVDITASAGTTSINGYANPENIIGAAIINSQHYYYAYDNGTATINTSVNLSEDKTSFTISTSTTWAGIGTSNRLSGYSFTVRLYYFE